VVGRLRWLLAVSICLPGIAAATTLEVQLAADHAEYGLAVRAQLVAQGARAPLRDVDLAPWQEDFGVVPVESGAPSDSDEQRLTLDLYPRRTGQLSLPALWLDGARTEPQRLSVSPATTDAGETLVTRVEWPARAPWQGEQVLVRATLGGAEPFSELVPAPGRSGAVRVVPLPASVAGGRARRALRTGWALFYPQPGETPVDLPPLHYRRGGQTLRTFYFPRATLAVRALPRYLPPTVPVGRVAIEVTPPPGKLLRAGAITLWQITITGDGIEPGQLPPALRALRSSADLEFLPPDSRRARRVDGDGVHARAQHTVAFRPRSTGRVDLPALSINYFDPDRGRLVTLRRESPRPFALGVVPFGVLLIVLAGAAVAGLRALARATQRAVARQRACNALARASSAAAARAALGDYAVTRGWPRNATLGCWKGLARDRFRRGEDMARLFDELARASWAPDGPAVAPSARALSGLLRHPARQGAPRRPAPATDPGARYLDLALSGR